jgi:hypothetical protein
MMAGNNGVIDCNTDDDNNGTSSSHNIVYNRLLSVT